MRRFGAVLCVLVCLSFGLQALGLDILTVKKLDQMGGQIGAALRLLVLGLGLWLWFGPLPGAPLRR